MKKNSKKKCELQNGKKKLREKLNPMGCFFYLIFIRFKTLYLMILQPFIS